MRRGGAPTNRQGGAVFKNFCRLPAGHRDKEVGIAPEIYACMYEAA